MRYALASAYEVAEGHRITHLWDLAKDGYFAHEEATTYVSIPTLITAILQRPARWRTGLTIVKIEEKEVVQTTTVITGL